MKGDGVDFKVCPIVTIPIAQFPIFTFKNTQEHTVSTCSVRVKLKIPLKQRNCEQFRGLTPNHTVRIMYVHLVCLNIQGGENNGVFSHSFRGPTNVKNAANPHVK
jgi:hypothetical protein